ncbi:hypothetical protein AK830_g3850 [Neonectria ditissima]|uniref:NAD-dependent epimerase/dehydratase domain-containing protein n=1 Tax=Neonectria ditissima TaxID=78410 RepID=A0A0P7BPK7_9HYPO|nr:hypothetical protein AK830_g3850 [Neonectria ditissima]
MDQQASQTILVTGANGYVSLHVIHHLLKSGYHVRGTVRSEKAAAKVRAALPQYYGSQLTTVLVKDLSDPQAYHEAFDEKTTGVIHVASPVHGHSEDNVRDLLEPAIKGATGILSAVTTMLDVSKGLRPGYVYTEKDWNPTSYEEAAVEKDHVALYVASKSLSERAVWDWVSKHTPSFDVVCVNPSMILGPHLDEVESMETLTSTAALLWSLVDAPSIPPLEYAGYVDVRDTAAILTAAFEVPEAGGQRLLAATHFDWQTTADLAKARLPEAEGNRIPAGNPGSGEKAALEHIYQVDGTKIVQVLGVEYRPLEETVIDTFKQFFEVDKKSKDKK